MNVRDLINIVEGEISSFPQNKRFDVTKTGVEIPKGFDSFYTKDVSDNISHIMGIRPNGQHIQISTTTKELADILAKAYNTGGKSNVSIEKVSMVSAFGSKIENAFYDMGVKFAEKPDSWQEIKDNYSCSEDQLQKVISIVGKIPELDSFDFFNNPTKHYPLSDIVSGLPEFCIVKYHHMNGKTFDKFVADKAGNKTYFRMWLYVRPKKLTVL